MFDLRWHYKEKLDISHSQGLNVWLTLQQTYLSSISADFVLGSYWQMFWIWCQFWLVLFLTRSRHTDSLLKKAGKQLLHSSRSSRYKCLLLQKLRPHVQSLKGRGDGRKVVITPYSVWLMWLREGTELLLTFLSLTLIVWECKSWKSPKVILVTLCKCDFGVTFFH